MMPLVLVTLGNGRAVHAEGIACYMGIVGVVTTMCRVCSDTFI